MKHNICLSALLLVLVIFSTETRSQSHFVPGTITTLAGTVEAGQIDFRTWYTNPDKIVFRDTAGSGHVYRPGEIAGFAVDSGDQYRSRKVDLDLSAIHLENILADDRLIMARDTLLFLHLLVDGPASLYAFFDVHNKPHFFIQMKGEKTLELGYRKTLQRGTVAGKQSGQNIVETKLYVGTLLVLLGEYPQLKPKIEQARFVQEDFVTIVSEYNDLKCGNVVCQEVSKSKKIRVSPGIVAGMSLSYLVFDGWYTDFPEEKISYGNDLSYSIGISLQLILPWNQSSWIIYNDLQFTPVHYQCDPYTVQDETISRYYSIVSGKVDMSYLKLSTMLRYQYPKWKVRPFLGVGMSNAFAVKSSSWKTEEIHHPPAPVTTDEEPLLPDLRTYEVGLLASIGATYKWFGIEVRYNYTNGVSPYITLKSNSSYWYFLVSFSL